MNNSKLPKEPQHVCPTVNIGNAIVHSWGWGV